MEANPVKEHRTVSRITTILEATSDAANGLRLADFAQILGAPKSSVHGLVKGLVARGYLTERGGVYALGPAIETLVATPARPTLIAAARSTLENVQRECNETVMLCSLVGDSVVYVDLVESDQMIRYSAPLRRRRPLYPTSAGKCFLAHFSPARRISYLQEHESDVERHPAIELELTNVRQEGVAYNRGETVADVFAVAAPVIVGTRVVACLAVAGPHARMGDVLPKVGEVLKAAAAEFAGRLR